MRNRGEFHRLPRSAFEPLKITAWLQSPVVTDATLPLDAVLYYTAMRECYGVQEYTEPGQDHSVRVAGVQLPLARCEEQGPQWYYAASFAQWPQGVAEGSEYWNKRCDLSLAHLIDFRGRRGVINIGSGAMKAYHMPVYYRHSLHVSWYAVGHRESVAGLLRHITHLGKKASQGWGAILRWEIVSHGEDWSVRDADGRLMRAIPAVGGVLTGFRPSYWLPKNQTNCEIPVDIIQRMR